MLSRDFLQAAEDEQQEYNGYKIITENSQKDIERLATHTGPEWRQRLQIQRSFAIPIKQKYKIGYDENQFTHEISTFNILESNMPDEVISDNRGRFISSTEFNNYIGNNANVPGHQFSANYGTLKFIEHYPVQLKVIEFDGLVSNKYLGQNITFNLFNPYLEMDVLIYSFQLWLDIGQQFSPTNFVYMPIRMDSGKLLLNGANEKCNKYSISVVSERLVLNADRGVGFAFNDENGKLLEIEHNSTFTLHMWGTYLK